MHRNHSLALPIAALLFSICSCTSSPPPAAPVASAPSSATAAGVSSTPPSSIKTSLEAIVKGPQRSEKNRARDLYRHPRETLEFFGIKPNTTVLELWPGGGWYTEILAPFLAEPGKLIVTSLDPNGPQTNGGNRAAKELQDRFQADPQMFGKVSVVRIDPPAHLDFGPDASVDTVLTFRNIHDWVRDGYADKVLAASYKVLKPNGVLGVEAHRGKPDADPAIVGKTGYLSEAYVTHLVEAAGFQLQAKSEINANPRDIKDYPEGVWTLPPTLRLGDKDRDKYAAIGESDRMTLRFVKSANR